MGTCFTLLDANRGAVRALGAAHRCPELGGFDLGLRTRDSEGQEPYVAVEPPAE